jgi:hypothetical protein
MKRTIVSQFNWLLVLSVFFSVIATAAMVTAFLLYRFQQDTIEKDGLHLKGLSAAVKISSIRPIP